MTTNDPFYDWYTAADSSENSLGTDQTPFGFGDVVGDFLESEPEIPFQGALARANLTPNQFLTFRNARENIFKQFQAQLDEQFRKGMLPTGTATNFFRNFDFQREFQRFGPSQRLGGGPGRFRPPIRFFTDQSRFRQ